MNLGFSSFDHFEEAMSGWDFDWRQLDRGPLYASLIQAANPHASISRVAFSRRFFQRGASPQGMLTFGMVGKAVGEIDWCRRQVPSDDLLVFNAGGDYESISHPGFFGHTLSFSEGLFDRIAADLEISVPLNRYREGGFAVQIGESAASDLRRRLRRLDREIDGTPEPLSIDVVRHELEFEIPARIIRMLATEPEVKDIRIDGFRTRAAQRARDFIDAHACEAPTIRDACQAAGISPRTLVYAFRELFGVTPKQFLQATRLDGVRKELHRKGPAVRISDVANTWGFWHMGQFAKDYRRHFGELPSESQRRVGSALIRDTRCEMQKMDR